MDNVEDTGKKRQIKRDSVDDEHPPSDGATVEKPKKLRKEEAVAAAATDVEKLEDAGEKSKKSAELEASDEIPVKRNAKNRATGSGEVEHDKIQPEKRLNEAGNDDEIKESISQRQDSSNDEIFCTDKTKDAAKETTRNSGNDEFNDLQQNYAKKTAAQHVKPQSIPTSKLYYAGGGQDLESALNILVGASSEGQQQKERLSQNSYLTFRIGHAGDASRLANWYREKRKIPPTAETCKVQSEVGNIPKDRSQVVEEGDNDNNEQDPSCSSKEAEVTPGAQSTENEASAAIQSCAASSTLDQESASSLELWLADGLGDEDMPPSLFALLAHVNYDNGNDKDEIEDDEETGNTKASRLAAVALLTVSWEHSERVLRVEWLQVDSDLDEQAGLIEKRMWLRLAALSLMSNCEMHVVDQSNSSNLALVAQEKC